MMPVQEPQQPTVRTAKIAYDATQGKYFIGGYVVDENNDTDVAVMAKYAGQEAPLPEGNWQTVDPASFSQYVQGIRDPGTFKLMAKNFSMGVDEMQQMAGLGLMWAGAETAGTYLADQQADLQPNQIYSRNFTDIGSTPESGVLDWMAATIGRLGPNIVESTISAGIGAAIGGAVSGPAAEIGAPIGAIAGFFGKTAVKKALLEAAKKQLKGEALEAGEKKLLLSAAGMTNESLAVTSRMRPAAAAAAMQQGLTKGAGIVGGQVARRAAQTIGAASVASASNIFQQTGQAYGETMADGSEGNRATALGIGVLGGLADTIPEFLLAGRLFSEVGGDIVGSVAKQRKAMDILKGVASGRTGRVAGYAGAGAAIEGTTEAGQELLQIAANPIVDWNSPEGMNRIINSFTAGALMGGTLGGAGGMFAGNLANNKQEANLLLPVSQSDPNFVQYREDLKAQLGEAATNKIFPPMAPQVLGAYPKRSEFERANAPGPTSADFNAANYPTRTQFEVGSQAALDAQRQAATTAQQGGAQQFFGGQQPTVAPVPVQQRAPGTVAPIPAAATIANYQPTPTPVQAQQIGQQAAAFYGRGQTPGPVNIPAPATPVVAQQQAAQAAQVQAQQSAQQQGAQQFFGGQQPAAAPVPTMAPPGTAAPLPIAPVVAQRQAAQDQATLQAQAQAEAARAAQEQTQVSRTGAQQFFGGQGAAALRRGPVAQTPMGAGMTTTVPATMVQPLRATINLKRPPAPAGGRVDALAFLASIADAGKNTFSAVELGKYLFPDKTKLKVLDRKRVNAVIEGLVRSKIITENKAGQYTINPEKVRATQPGAGTGSTTAAGKQGSQDGGAGKSNNLRKGQPPAAPTEAARAQEPPTGGEAVRQEAGKPVVVERKQRKILTAAPPNPKDQGAAARPSQEAEEDKAAKKARLAAEKKAAAEANKYDNLSEDQQIALAKEGERKGESIATLIEREQDIALPPPNATKEEADLFEVYGTIGNIIFAQRENNRKGANLSVKDNAKRDFTSNVAVLLGWATDGTLSAKARNTARAYLESYISTDETLGGIKQAIKDAQQGRFALSTFDTVENPIDENGRPAKGVNPIRVRSILDKFRKGLAKAPQFFVYKNQADLQSRNPDLYQQAVGSRPQGDFDTAPASGFAFDGKVLVFTDRIPTEKYMRLLLAHEAIGHFGMRSLLPAKQFDALMDYVYDNNDKLHLRVDAELAGNTNVGARREAVEEYMAKYAESLDSSIITRVWNAIKNVLNKLGIKFEDDIVRYLVSQARSTVRNGSSMFTPSTFALNVHNITANNGTGRYSTEPIYNQQHALRNSLALADAQPFNVGEMQQTLKDWGIASMDVLEVFNRNVFRLRNYNALRNHGALRFEYLKDDMRSAAHTLRNTFNLRLAGLLALTGDSRRVVSYALITSRRIADRRFMLDKELRNAALLTLGDDQPDGFRDITVNEEVLKRLLKLGTLPKDELDNGAEVSYDEPIEGGKYKKTTTKIPGVKELLKRGLTDDEYALYVKTREDLAALDIERLKGQYQNFLATEKVTIAGVRKVLADKNMTDEDVNFVKNIVNHAKQLFIDDIDYDERGMPNITPKAASRMEQYFKAVNTAVVKKEFTEELKAEVRKFYLPKPQDGKEQVATDATNKKAEAAIKRIEEFRSRRTEFTGLEEQGIVYTLQDRVKEIVLADAAFDKAQMAARRSIASSHVPLWREGSYQVRVEAQINGKTVKLHPEVQNKMIYSLSDNVAQAENEATSFNDTMKGLEYSGLVYNEENGEYKPQTFKLFARSSKVVSSVASDPSIDIDNFLYTLRVLGQPLTPDKHAKAITMLTAPGSALRKALRFDDTPGYNPDKTVEAIARHVTTRSSLIAKTRFQPFMRELMDLSTEVGQTWFGDAKVVMEAKENFDKATDSKIKAYWEDKLKTELYRYVKTNPGAKGWDGSRATFNNQPAKADLGMRDYSDSVKEMEWLQGAANISESTFEGKRVSAMLKTVTSIGFLGGMFTQFAQNLMSPVTNVLPYLASKDSQTGFGGGFGMTVMPTYLKAFKDVVGFRGLNPFSDPIADAKAFETVANEIKAARDTNNTAAEAALVQKYGLSYYEALNIAREIREGKLIPAQANALLETARGIFTGTAAKYWMKFSDVYMSPFNVSEQATRRATFLTSFRLEFDRLKQAGFNEDKASEMARMFAVDTVDKTLGEYSNSNRPPVWRDGWQSLLFVYKTYPLTSLLLFKNLSRAGKIGMLTSLFVLAGAAGFPLVDDMEDLIDTLSQRFGLDLGQGPSVRMAIIKQLEEFFPGWSDVILRGPMNHYTGADIGAKFGMEDFLPGTGIFLKGANTTQELKSIAGPVIGMGLSMSEFVYNAVRAPLSSTVSLVDVARSSPISLMRAGGDVAAYMQNGAIVDKRGYVVSPDVSAMTLVSRLLGFYPADAARQYDFIKYANRMNYDYKEIGTAYKLAWIKAKQAGDDAGAATIVREVNDWNDANRGGPGFIRNFLSNAQKALKEARRPAGERLLKSAPLSSRKSLDDYMSYIVD
jgi:hypothetical protein